MDKLKPLLKYHFWIACTLVMLATVGVGVWSWMTLGEVINRQKTDIVGAESKAKSVTSVKADVGTSAVVSVHPNDETIQGMKQEIDLGKDELLAGWERLYTEQKDLLGWPGNVIDPDVSRPFDNLRADQFVFDPNSTKGEVQEQRRKQIKTFFPRLMPELVKSVRAQWNEEEVTGEAPKTPSVVASAGAKDDMERLMFDQPIVEWSVADQAKWYGLLTNFKGRNGNQAPDGTPTTVQVLYLKENLVLLNGVLEIIREANRDAMVPSQAAIREIGSIMIGKEAHEAEPLDAGGMDGGGAGGFAGEMDNRMRMMKDAMQNILGGGKTEKTQVSASDVERLDPAHLRYVDKDFNPIPAAQYRSSTSANQLSGDSWMSVVKIVPVRLRLRVDERRVADILEKCANAKLPLEVRQVTIIGGELPADAAGVEATGRTGGPTNSRNPSIAGSGESATIDENEGRGGPAAGAGADGGLGGAGGGEKNFKSPEFNSHFLVPLEIYGVIKFYSKPSAEAIGKIPAATPTL